MWAVVVVGALTPATAHAANRYDFCIMQPEGAPAPHCAQNFVLTSSNNGNIYAGFRDHLASRRGEVIGVCVKKRHGSGFCMNQRYLPRRSPTGALVWNLSNLTIATFGPGDFVVRWYRNSDRAKPRLLGYRTFHVRAS